MYDLRMKIFQELANSAVTVYVADRIFQANSQFNAPKEKPFLVIRFGVTTPFAPAALGAMGTNFQLWIHDDPGDYHTIDLIAAECRMALLSASRETGFYEFRYLETSRDHEDDWMGTIVKYCRYQAVTREPVPVLQ